MSSIKRKSVAVAGTIGVLAATLVGVGANPAAAATTDIKVGAIAINAAGVIPLAQDSGIFAKNGLNVTEVVLFPAPPPSLAGLAAGAVQFVYAPSNPNRQCIRQRRHGAEGSGTGRRLQANRRCQS